MYKMLTTLAVLVVMTAGCYFLYMKNIISSPQIVEVDNETEPEQNDEGYFIDGLDTHEGEEPFYFPQVDPQDSGNDEPAEELPDMSESEPESEMPDNGTEAADDNETDETELMQDENSEEEEELPESPEEEEATDTPAEGLMI